jgi:hypothetical protein
MTIKRTDNMRESLYGFKWPYLDYLVIPFDFALFLLQEFWAWIVGLLLVLGLFWVVAHFSYSEYNKFLEGCQQDHKEYECMAMWRQGDKAYIPVFIPMPTTR